MLKLMVSLVSLYPRREPNSVQLIVTMMPGAKTVPKGKQRKKEECILWYSRPELKTQSQVSRSLVVQCMSQLQSQWSLSRRGAWEFWKWCQLVSLEGNKHVRMCRMIKFDNVTYFRKNTKYSAFYISKTINQKV